MQLHVSSATNATAVSAVLASQTIDISASPLPIGGAILRQTERVFRLAGERAGIDTFTSIDDALAAARQLSAGSMPGLAVMQWRGGYRIHDVHTSSRSSISVSTPGNNGPRTHETGRSSVPFAAGNVRDGVAAGRNMPAVVRDAKLIALVDGDRALMPSDETWSGLPKLVVRPAVDQ